MEAEIRDISESMCFICLENTPDSDTLYIKKFMGIPCSCGWASHIKCYEEWIQITDMICPYCRLYDDYTFDDEDNDIGNGVGNNEQRLRPLPAQEPPQVQHQAQFQLQPQQRPHILMNQDVHRNEYQVFFILRCIDFVGNGILIVLIYFILMYYFMSISKNFYIKEYNPLQPMNFY